jgi:8-oxo-dGTP diphosphatase
MNELTEVQGAILYTSGPRRSDYLFRISLKAVIFNTNGEVLVVRESDRDWWDLPGGGMDHGESVEQALARELNEEVLLEGSFSYRPILIEDPKYLSDHNFYQTRIVCVVVPENLSFRAGEDGDVILFVDPATFESSNKATERKIFEYAKLAN